MREGELNVNSGAEVEQPQAQPGETTYDNLGEQVPYDKEGAQRLQNGETVEDGSSEQAETQDGDETRLDIARSEQPDLQAEQQTDVQAEQADAQSEKQAEATQAEQVEQVDKLEEQEAEQPQNGEESEQSTNQPEKTDDKTEQTNEKPEREPTRREKIIEEAERNQQNREKSRAEKRLEEMQERLNNINQELSDTYADKERLEAEIDTCESLIENNIDEHNQLADKANALKLEIKKTKRNAISNATMGLKLVMKQLSGKWDEADKIADDFKSNIAANKDATMKHEETEQAIEANETEKSNLDAHHADIIDERNVANSKITRLERQRAELSKRIELMKEETANETWRKAWKDAQESVLSEIGTNNVSRYRNKLKNEAEERKERLDEDLNMVDLGSSEIINNMIRRKLERHGIKVPKEEFDAENKADAEEEKERLQSEYQEDVAKIDEKREKVDRYFPVWQERIKNIKENNLVRGALSTLKRKMLMRIYGI